MHPPDDGRCKRVSQKESLPRRLYPRLRVFANLNSLHHQFSTSRRGLAQSAIEIDQSRKPATFTARFDAIARGTPDEEDTSLADWTECAGLLQPEPSMFINLPLIFLHTKLGREADPLEVEIPAIQFHFASSRFFDKRMPFFFIATDLTNLFCVEGASLCGPVDKNTTALYRIVAFGQ